MSFQQKIDIKITNLDVFKEVCKKYGVSLIDNKLKYKGRIWGRIEKNDTHYQLIMDVDRNYSPLARKVILPGGGNLLCRDYVEKMVMKELSAVAGTIIQRKETEDGKLKLRIAV